MSKTSLGCRFGKPDIERLGLFSEMSYMNGKGYVPVLSREKQMTAPNFLNTGTKSRTGTQHGYFEEEYKRIYVGECLPRPSKENKTKSLTPFIVNSLTKKHSTPGDNYGTFTDHIDEFSPLRQGTAYKHEPPNVMWRCGKIGGPGYADSGIDKYPEHVTDPYGSKLIQKVYGKMQDGPFLQANHPDDYFDKNPFREDPTPTVGHYLDRSVPSKSKYGDFIPTGPAKWQGGSHAGCFDPFPAFMPCKYVSQFEATKPSHDKKKMSQPFMPTPLTPKTLFTTSVVNHSVDMFMNTNNRETYVPCYVKHLLSDTLF